MTTLHEQAPAVEVSLDEHREIIRLDNKLRAPETDLGNARRVVADHRDRLRHVPGLGWHVYDGTRWARDDDGAAERLVKQTVSAILSEELPRLADDEDRHKKRARWGFASQARPRIEAAQRLAATEAELVARAEDLDADDHLLNTPSGTVDLRTGELRAHDPADLITQCAGATYDPDARSPRWEAFLRDSSGGDHELTDYLQRVAGYALTGSTDEECLFLTHGPAASGKTTFLEALKSALGTYAATADFSAFLARRGDHGPRPDLARLVGKRLVTASEVSDGARFDAATLKSLTGGDTITARELYSKAFEYRARFTLFLACNALPDVPHDDEGIWRRMRVVPFAHAVPADRRDPALKRQLIRDPDEQAAILAWAVKGCLEWQRTRLGTPAAVETHTAAYRRESDPLAEWLDERCVLDPEAWTPSADLHASYSEWCRIRGTHQVSTQAFAGALRVHGATAEKRRGQRGWRGIGDEDWTHRTHRTAVSGTSPRARAYVEKFPEVASTPSDVSTGVAGSPAGACT